MNLEQFITTQLESVDHLRILLHLKGTPRTEWDVLDLAMKLYLRPMQAAAVLADLETKGLVLSREVPPLYRFQPKTPELERLVEALAEMDRTRPVTLINLIYSVPRDVRAFADAFKLRKEKGD